MVFGDLSPREGVLMRRARLQETRKLGGVLHRIDRSGEENALRVAKKDNPHIAG